MKALTFGDMAQRLALQRQGAGLKRSVATLSHELTTGAVKDKASKLRGDFSMLTSVTNAMNMASARKTSAQSAGTFLSLQQSILGNLSTTAQSGALEQIVRNATANGGEISGGIDMMARKFQDSVAQLNTNFAGRALFEGISGNGTALIAADDMLDAMLSDLTTALPAGADAEVAQAFIAGWFADGGQFDATAYLGGPPIPERLALGHGVTVGFEITAQDQSIREFLAALATGAILSKGLFEGDLPEQKAMLERATFSLAASEKALIGLSARLGLEEGRASVGRARAEAEHTAMAITRAELTEADPYETAMRLEQAITQLDMIYNLTARLSRLSLSAYLR